MTGIPARYPALESVAMPGARGRGSSDLTITVEEGNGPIQRTGYLPPMLA